METYIAMLRGINVSGQKKILMEDLKSYMEVLGFQNVRIYIQSGNVVFENNAANQLDIATQISTKLFEKYGFQIHVLVKNCIELIQVLKNNPFMKLPSKNIDILYVTFLSDYPKQELLSKLEHIESNGDEFILSGDVIYICCLNGYGHTKLTNSFFESKLKVTATTRNWKTILKLSGMAMINI